MKTKVKTLYMYFFLAMLSAEAQNLPYDLYICASRSYCYAYLI